MPPAWQETSPQAKQLATRSPDAVIAALAARQHGVVSRAQLRAAGLADGSIAARAADGRLVRLHRGVYAVAHTALTPDAHRLAAVLACGRGAVLSHRSAAAAWGLLTTYAAGFEVSVPPGGRRSGRGIRTYRVRLDPTDVTTDRGIPLTTVARTYLDLAAAVPRSRLDRALERGEQLQLFDLRAVDDVLARHGGRPGAPALRAAVEALRPEAEFTRSHLERFAVALVRRHGLPRPAVNTWMHGFEVDLLWPEQRVVVEVDTYTHHGSRHAFRRDRSRDGDLAAAGYRVVRFTGDQLEHDGARCARILRAVLGLDSAR